MSRTLRLFVVLLLLVAAPAWAADSTLLNGTIQTWHSGAATLADGVSVTSAAITLTNVGYPKATCELFIPTTTGTVAANGNVVVWFNLNPDGTNFEDAPPARLPDFSFPLRAVSTAQRVIARDVSLPPQAGFRVVIRNNGTGVTMNTTWTLKCTPYTQRLQ
jgi:hypothetical protein